MTKRTVITAAVLSAPALALANAGTPLMWAGMLHLMFGNLLIGILEGLLLGWLFKAPKLKAVGILILANYLSAWAGGFLLSWLCRFPDITIENLKPWLIFFFVLAFALTLLIELTFFRMALRKAERSFRAAIKPTFLIHLISYALLTVWYGLASGTSLMTELKVVDPSALKPEASYTLYYISNDGEKVIEHSLSGEVSEVACKISSTNQNDRLFTRIAEDGGCNLSIRYDGELPNYTEDTLLLNISKNSPSTWHLEKEPNGDPKGTWFNFGDAPSLAASKGWNYRTGFWAIDGISGEGPNEESFHYALETPFESWTIRNAVSLGDALLIFQLGNDQICMLDHESGSIALLARGRGPIVAVP